MKAKKLFAIVFCFVIAISCVSCKQNKPIAEYNVGSIRRGVSVDGFAQRLQEEDLENKDFYVLAPQYVTGSAYNTGMDVSLTSSYQSGAETKTEQGLVREYFSVYNEEKYGKQITDWGQYSGEAKNFTIKLRW